MAEVKYEGLVELRSRLPHISETVITYFLTKYGNVEEIYEKLKNGPEDTPDPDYMKDDSFSSSQNYISPTTSTKTNAQFPRQPWTTPPQDGYHRQLQHTQDGRAQYQGQKDWPSPSLPYPHDNIDRMPVLPRIWGDSPSDSELILDQKQQVQFLDKARMECSLVVSSLREEVDQKRQVLTRLRIDVSDAPTQMDITALQDIITTLEDDINIYQIKIQAEQHQSENLDKYTEEGVRWDCRGCKFINHPLMSRCESCNQNRL